MWKSGNYFSPKTLDEVLVENSKFSRTALKNKLYKQSIKQRKCEICGLGEEWQGKKMSLILDHINGVYNDNRLENLRILCPNCNATLDTHCGKNLKSIKPDKQKNIYYRNKKRPDKEKKIKDPNWRTKPRPERSKINWPKIEELQKLIQLHGYSKTGRILGISDNSVRKHFKRHENNLQPIQDLNL